jgi:bifunctional DNA-binding transcriptional regulator/antitoxin component of YhaV-PrlF toxin-antitoxin module
MCASLLSETRISKGFLTVVPSEVRRLTGIREGDRIEWMLRGSQIMVRIRKRKTIADAVGLISHGGDAVRSKKGVQGLRARVR